MKDVGLVTIVIPVYNVEKYVGICIESVIKQSYSNIEIIIVNDGSTDNSGKVCEDYKRQYARIKLIHKTNGGLSSARNAAVTLMSGKYIAFIDSDDYIHPRTVELWTKYMHHKGANIVSGRFINVYEDKDNPENQMKKELNMDEYKYYTNEDALYNLFNENYVETVLICNKLFDARIFRDRILPEDKFHVDERIIPEILYNSTGIIYLEGIVYYYLQRKSSFMNVPFNYKRLHLIEASCDRTELFKSNNLMDLYKLSLFNYMNQIILYYSKFVESNNDEIAKELVNRYKKEYNDKIKPSKISWKRKLYLASFRLSPKIHNKLLEILKLREK